MVLGMSTKSQRRKALEKLPTDLFGSFKIIISRIRKCANHAKFGLGVLMWLHFAYRPLKLEELQHALAVEKGHTEFDVDNIPSQKVLLDSCLGLVVVDEETSTVRFIHYTLEEYFRKYTMEEFPNGCSSIAETCLTYLNFGQVKQHCTTRYDLSNKANEYAFLNYAALYWGTYVKRQYGCNQTRQYDDDLAKLANIVLDHESERPPGAIQALYSQLREHSALQPPTQKFSGVHTTVYFGLHEIMGYLCQVGRDVDLKDDCGRSPLSWAAEGGHEVVMQLLMERNDVDLNSRDTNGWTPLSWAAQKGHEAAVRLLIGRSDTDINCKDMDGRTPLSWAAQKGHEAIVQLLIGRSDIDINCKDKFGLTPLLWAAGGGHEAAVRFLIGRSDIDINCKDMDGRTPLLWAVMREHDAVVRLLIGRSDVDINCEDMSGQTPYSWVVKERHEAFERLLIGRSDIDTNCKNEIGLTSLSLAIEEGHEGIAHRAR